jgi:peroxiredoxin Q/BCP
VFVHGLKSSFTEQNIVNLKTKAASYCFRIKHAKAMKRFFVPALLILGLALHMEAQVSLGEEVPNFTALDQDSQKWTLKKELKQADYLVVYFYPVAFTGGCTAQACSYRDQKGELEAVGAQVVGVSGDKPETLGLFALEHNLNFTLLSDESGATAEIFGVPHGQGGTITREIKGQSLDLERGTTIQRWTFIINKEGKLIYKDTEVDAANDSGKVMDYLSSLQ